jgi:hypothetical protein
MDHSEILDLIDARLLSESRLIGSEHTRVDDERVWSRDQHVARIGRSGSTGIVVSVGSGDRILHQRVFARSPESVERIARVITEHLTEYAH